MDFYLEARGGKTVLRLVHSGFGRGPDWDEEYDGIRRGWRAELRALRHYLELHRGTPRLVAWARTATPLPPEEAWKRLLSPQGLLRQGTLANLREGDRYSITAATGDALQGVVQVLAPPKDFSASVENLNNALFRVLLDKHRGIPEAIIWLSAYGLPPAEVQAFQARWTEHLRQLFPEAR
ncbi:MAG: SRPBCC domain-containing protein [Terriglobia bacterium]